MTYITEQNEALNLLQNTPEGWEHFQYFTDYLKADKSFVLKAVDVAPLCFSMLSDTLRNDKDVAFAALKLDTGLYEFVGDDLKKEKDLPKQYAKFLIMEWSKPSK